MTEKEKDLLIDQLKQHCSELQWMARRYAEGRNTYAPSTVNSVTRALIKLGVKMNPGGEQIIWARDGMGRRYDGLTEAQATPGTPEAMGEA